MRFVVSRIAPSMGDGMKRPWMPLYVGDFRLDTLDLDAAEVGVYMILLMLCWQRDDAAIPDDMVWLKRTLKTCIADFHGHQFNRIVPSLLERYFSLADGKWQNKRLTNERQIADKFAIKQKQIANKRWAKVKENKKVADAKAMPSQSHSHKKDSEAYASDAAEPASDARTTLFREGLARMERLTGRPASSCRPILGRWLRDAQDDALRVGRLLEDAELNRVADPVAWITRALKPKAPPLSEKELTRERWRNTLDKLGKYAAGSGGDHGAEVVRLLPAAGSREPSGSAGGGCGVV